MKKLEYFTIKPNLKQYYGITVDEKTKLDEQTEDGTVKQHIENLVLTTEISKKVETGEHSPYDIEENSKMTIKMPSGTVLIWDENEGFIISPYPMVKLSQLSKEIEDMKDIYKKSNV